MTGQLPFEGGYSPLPRATLYDPVMKKAAASRVLMWLYLKARDTPKAVRTQNDPDHPVLLQVGQTMCGEHQIAKELGIGRNSARRALEWLARRQLIDMERSMAGTIVTIVNYGNFKKPK